MPASNYVQSIRKRIGHDLLILPSVSVLVYDARRRVLLVKSVDSGHWMTVGGQIEAHEPPADAAVRECWEETGLYVRPTRIVGVFGGPDFEHTYPNGDRTVYTSVCFAGEVLSGTARPDHSETSELGWFTEEDIAALPMSNLTKSILGHAFVLEGDALFQPPRWTPPSGDH